ncbi:hypothetical protein ES705_40431 [subsurface metagenome]
MNLPICRESSKERGSISPTQLGTVGLRPKASDTITRDPTVRLNW